jgi:hypothetical protein
VFLFVSAFLTCCSHLDIGIFLLLLCRKPLELSLYSVKKHVSMTCLCYLLVFLPRCLALCCCWSSGLNIMWTCRQIPKLQRNSLLLSSRLRSMLPPTSGPKREAVYFSEILVYTYKFTQGYNTEYKLQNMHYHETLASRMLRFFLYFSF